LEDGVVNIDKMQRKIPLLRHFDKSSANVVGQFIGEAIKDQFVIGQFVDHNGNDQRRRVRGVIVVRCEANSDWHKIEIVKRKKNTHEPQALASPQRAPSVGGTPP
jgi:hypothetical protein